MRDRLRLAAMIGLVGSPAAILAPASAGLQPPSPPAPPPVNSATRSLFIRHCAACHGLDGHGDGAAAEQLYPKPRAFRESPFRFAATGLGPDAVLEALRKTIREGVPRSAMPGFGGILTEPQIDALSGYVNDLVKDAPPFEPAVDIGRIAGHPTFNKWLAAEGARLFFSMACVSCHGNQGRGDGPEMKGLVDSLGRPIRPGDLASGQYKSGGTPEDIYRTIVEGVPGTPMRSFGQQLIDTKPDGTRDDRRVWALVAFVKSLAPLPSPGVRTSGAEFRVQDLPDAAALGDPSNPAWLDVKTEPISVRPLWQRGEETTELEVAAVRHGDQIGFHLLWHDRTPSVDQDSGRFPDGVAVMIAQGDEVPALPMGVDVPGFTETIPVNIWHWKASRQYDVSFGRRHDSDDPRVLPDSQYHLFRIAPERVASVQGARPAAAGIAHDQDLRLDEPLYRAAVAAGNIHSDPAMIDHAVLEANAQGFGTLKYQPEDHQDMLSTAVWANGNWFVTMYRPASTGQDLDVPLAGRRRVPVAFAVWDGAKGDRNGVKLVSGWHWLVLDK